MVGSLSGFIYIIEEGVWESIWARMILKEGDDVSLNSRYEENL